jgi:hypothetical protein
VTSALEIVEREPIVFTASLDDALGHQRARMINFFGRLSFGLHSRSLDKLPVLFQVAYHIGSHLLRCVAYYLVRAGPF